ncbi:hypothetical protein BJ138DRAFT_1118415 [Hygrophoropsis aurantiaca]|uniref:Uncharacterized protein n=1 Tax=Hygrophoropsis aurantiaca TaxID=72124 RepID=A0ACB7ZWI9_9AGAM|nr:hypothetical protein BJ138DRAFT_1118415 [Hygrophoropsis aurantiaca]
MTQDLSHITVPSPRSQPSIIIKCPAYVIANSKPQTPPQMLSQSIIKCYRFISLLVLPVEFFGTLDHSSAPDLAFCPTSGVGGVCVLVGFVVPCFRQDSLAAIVFTRGQLTRLAALSAAVEELNDQQSETDPADETPDLTIEKVCPYHTPEFNAENPRTFEKFFDIIHYWFTECGVTDAQEKVGKNVVPLRRHSIATRIDLQSRYPDVDCAMFYPLQDIAKIVLEILQHPVEYDPSTSALDTTMTQEPMIKKEDFDMMLVTMMSLTREVARLKENPDGNHSGYGMGPQPPSIYNFCRQAGHFMRKCLQVWRELAGNNFAERIEEYHHLNPNQHARGQLMFSIQNPIPTPPSVSTYAANYTAVPCVLFKLSTSERRAHLERELNQLNAMEIYEMQTRAGRQAPWPNISTTQTNICRNLQRSQFPESHASQLLAVTVGKQQHGGGYYFGRTEYYSTELREGRVAQVQGATIEVVEVAE